MKGPTPPPPRSRLTARIPDLSEQSGIEAVDGWHLKVREGGRVAELAAEKSSLWLRRVEAGGESL